MRETRILWAMDGFWLFIYSPSATDPSHNANEAMENLKSVSIIWTSIKRENGGTIHIRIRFE